MTPLLPPFLAVEDEPLSREALDEFTEAALMVAAETNSSVAEAVGELVDADHAEADLSTPAQRWQITGTDTAQWAMSRLAEAEQKRRAAVEQAQEWRDRIDAWLAHELSPLEATASFFQYHLERYALALREADPKAKSLVLPSGTVRTRESGPKVVVTDENRAIMWAADSLDPLAFSEVVKTTQKVIAAGLKAAVKLVETEDGFYAAVDEYGQVVPGVEVEPPSVTAKAVPDVE